MKPLSLSGLFLALVLNSLISYSQTINYNYDNAGNRVSKKIIVLKSALISNPEIGKDEKKEVLKDITFNNQEVKIYPNPTAGIVEIEIPENSDNPEIIQIIVMDINGRKIFDKRQEPTRTSIDLSNCPNGIYFLNLKKGQVISQWKIVKQ